ncbi:hypothetical protein TCAL_02085 [Tigriopus californicus]|uniref:GH18 domain-containing protein n=1 Tax=Tigriopus californicus TaxID=6832 RepID=A0A553NCL8_TIGCA|nr:acidic mammalian chitinase-like [Tigriopus californicus]TRY63193.1 hypothetical protein TCAL_02085 [Tigriopus californicus]
MLNKFTFALGVATVIAVLAIGAHSQTVNDHDKIVSCYIGTWGFYRQGMGKFDIEDIDTQYCTHGFYGFADLDNITWTMYAYDPWYDLAPEDCEPFYCNYDSYRRFTALGSDKFVPILSIGGWNAGSGKYSMMAKDPAKRKTFVDSVIPFLEKFNFKGLDLDWENPGERLGADATVDKENFNKLVDELYQAMNPKGMILTSAMASGYKTVETGYDVPFLSERLAILNIMTYDYHGYWEGHNYTGVNSPIYPREEETDPEHPWYKFNQFDAIQNYIAQGAPLDKLVLGVASYGRGFVLDDETRNGLYCDTKAGIPMGPYSIDDGFWGYIEILQAQSNDTLAPNLPGANPKEWTVVVDGCYQTPYMYNGPYWIGYDNEESIKKKVDFANLLGIAGVMMWSIDTDDFVGVNGGSAWPLLRKVNQELINGDTFDPNVPGNPGCKTAPSCADGDFDMTTAEDTTTTSTTEAWSTTTSSADDSTTSGQGGLPAACTTHNEYLPYPGDCHKYYRCVDSDGDGVFDIEVYNCGDFVYDPNSSACVDPNLLGYENLCES